MISETWFCVCMTQLSHLGPSVPHSLIFCTLKYTKMKKNIQNPVSIKLSLIRTLPSSLIICCLWFLLYCNSRAEQLADTAWPIQYLLVDLSWKKSVLDLVGQSERQIAQFSVRPQRAEPSLWIPTSPPHLVSPASLLPFCSHLLSCYSAFPLFSWFRKVLEAIGCLHLCLSLTAPYSPLSRSQGLWWPSLPLGHCSVVILVSSRLSISLDSMYFLFCIILNSFLLDNDFHHTHSFVFPVLEMQLNPSIRRKVLCCVFRSRRELKKICWMKG